jgi:hypothetical protein
MRPLIPWLLLVGLQVGPAAATDDVEPQDTGEQDTDEGDTDPVTPFRPGSSASELAGERGGMDCAGSGGSAALLVLLPLATLGRRRPT